MPAAPLGAAEAWDGKQPQTRDASLTEAQMERDFHRPVSVRVRASKGWTSAYSRLGSSRSRKARGGAKRREPQNGLRATDPGDAGPGQDPQPVGRGAPADCDPWDLPPSVVVSDQPRAAGLWARQGL